MVPPEGSVAGAGFTSVRIGALARNSRANVVTLHDFASIADERHIITTRDPLQPRYLIASTNAENAGDAWRLLG